MNDPGPDLLAHRRAILQRYRRLDLVPAAGDSAAGVFLDEVYVAPRVRPWRGYSPQLEGIPPPVLRRLQERGEVDRAFRPGEMTEDEAVHRSEPARSAVDLCTGVEHPRLAVLGAAGMGKSTLLRYLAVRWALLPVDQLRHHPLPVLVELSGWETADDGEAHGLLRRVSPSPCGWLQQRLQDADGVLLLLDGLEAVSASLRGEVLGSVAGFLEAYPHVRAVLTAGVLGCDPLDLVDRGFRPFLLEAFDDVERDGFGRRWFTAAWRDRVDRDQVGRRFVQACGESAAAAELATHPLLLTGLARLFGRAGALPERSSELYEGLAVLSLTASGPADLNRRRTLLQRVALAMRMGKAALLLTGDALAALLQDVGPEDRRRDETRGEIAALDPGGLIFGCAGGRWYGFRHPRLLSYFCASELAWRFQEARTLCEADLKTEVFLGHVRDPDWHEVLALVAATIDVNFVRPVLQALLEAGLSAGGHPALVVAARCLDEVGDRRTLTPLAEKLRDATTRLVDFDLAYWYEPGDAEAEGEIRRVRGQAIRSRVATWKNEPRTRLWLKARAHYDEDPFVRVTALRELVRGPFYLDAELLGALKVWARADPEPWIRVVALQELARGFTGDPEVPALLKEVVQEDAHGASPWARMAAVEELASHFSADPQTLPLLMTWAQTEKDVDVRAVALEQLARRWPDRDTRTLLWSLVKPPEEPLIRVVAMEELSRRFWEECKIGELLHSLLAQPREETAVRVVAVEELARSFRDRSRVRRALMSLTADPELYLQEATLRALGRRWPRDREVYRWLQERATSSEHISVRRTAVRELARHSGALPETLAWLRGRAVEDPSAIVRAAALEELARRFGGEASSRSLLQDRARGDREPVVRAVAVREAARMSEATAELALRLRRQIAEDDDGVVREAAVGELARGFHCAETESLLRELAATDADPPVRRAASRHLLRGYPSTSVELLCARARDDAHPLVRGAMVEELARNCRDDPRVLALLKSHVQGDEDSGVRGVAIKTLARLWRQDPETLALLKARALSDEDPWVRKLAGEELYRSWKDDAEVQLFLTEL